ncbi:MAG: hypothetical protein ACLRMJ_08025 [Alistipes finegoldii]
MKYFGAHVSAAGVWRTPPPTHKMELRLRLFTKNQRQWVAKPLAAARSTLSAGCESTATARPRSAHDSYLINLGHPSGRAENRAQPSSTRCSAAKRWGSTG